MNCVDGVEEGLAVMIFLFGYSEAIVEFLALIHRF